VEGCLRGCLDFLKPPTGQDPAEPEDIEMAVDEEDGIVKYIELGGGLEELDFD
jgi:hypothetical protein